MKNVVLVTIDTLRKDMVGCYGVARGLTPFVDSVAARSLVFTRAQAVGPYTQASFPGILTSTLYFDEQDHGKGKTLSPRRTLISEHLGRQGIATAAFHSNPYLSEFFGWNRGWTRFYDSMDAEVTDEVPYVRGFEINRRADNWLAEHVRGSDYPRFFLWVHYMDIHEPYVPDAAYLEAVDPSLRLERSEMYGLFKSKVLPRDASDARAVEALRKLYMAHVREVDGYIRELFLILERRGVLADSVAILTADHGEEFGEHGGLSHDGKMFSELVDVPLLIFGQGVSPGRCDRLVSNIDISPTVVHLFGLPSCPAFQGVSLLPLEAYSRACCFGEAMGKRGKQKESDRPVLYWRQDNLKMICEIESDTWRLYDLEADPRETCDVGAGSARAAELRRKLQPRVDRLRAMYGQ